MTKVYVLIMLALAIIINSATDIIQTIRINNLENRIELLETTTSKGQEDGTQ